jgi:Site-specific recombinase XerD
METRTQRTVYPQSINAWVTAFLSDCRVRNLSHGTLTFYTQKLDHFQKWCQSNDYNQINQVDAGMIRLYMLYLAESHNPGGVHAYYRSLKAFLHWYGREISTGWNDPFKRVHSPKVPEVILDPVSYETVEALLKVCNNDRDKAIILTLIDTGVRARELCQMRIQDINLIAGEILIANGKGGKARYVFIGHSVRNAIRRHLESLPEGIQGHSDRLWSGKNGEPLSYDGLRAIIGRLAMKAGIKPPALHSFRRAFAINMLRAGTDIFTLQRLMGHKGIQVLRRYLAQTNDDLRDAHHRASPADSITKRR